METVFKSLIYERLIMTESIQNDFHRFDLNVANSPQFF